MVVGHLSVAQTLLQQSRFHGIVSKSRVLIHCKDTPSHQLNNFGLCIKHSLKLGM